MCRLRRSLPWEEIERPQGRADTENRNSESHAVKPAPLQTVTVKERSPLGKRISPLPVPLQMEFTRGESWGKCIEAREKSKPELKRIATWLP